MSDILPRLTAALEGRYSIEREVGAGGMATVYLAHDEKHDRPVAVKVLRPELAAVMGSERFLSEIRTTANLQHPHILALYDSGDADGFLYYVMPYVEGETLEGRIDREKQLPIDEAVSIARAIAGALHAAHEQGVVHRDIKPANILFTHDQPLVADFGIALAVQEAGGGRLTETGLSLGTPFYMSPEQATADRAPDARSDIYSLGSVLYEMLTGEPPFSGTTTQSVIARILTADPPRPTETRKAIPPHVEGVLIKALERLPADRFANAAEFAEALGDPNYRYGGESGDATEGVDTTAMALIARRNRVLTGATVVMAGALAVSLLMRGVSGEAAPVFEFAVQPDSTHTILSGVPGTIALSHDGLTLAYVGGRPDGTRLIYQRRLDDRVAIPVPGTEDAHEVFFSPDDNWLAFSTLGLELKKIRLAGGSASTITTIGGLLAGGHWGEGDRIVYGVTGPEGILSVPANGGAPEEILFQDADTLVGLVDPFVMPGGEQILVSALTPTPTLSVLDLESGVVRPIGPGMTPRFLADGRLVYGAANGDLLLQDLDIGSWSLQGEPVRIAEGVGGWIDISRDFAVSSQGVIAFLVGAGVSGELMLVSRESRTRSMSVPEGVQGPRVSPDHDQILFSTASATNAAVNVYSISQQTTRLIVGGEDWNTGDARWSPSGDSIVFSSGPPNNRDLFIASASGVGEPRLILDAEGDQIHPSFTWDGSHVVYATRGSLQDIMAVPVGGGNPIEVAHLGDFSSQASPSPTGPWVTFISEQTGRSEVYVTKFPGDGVGLPVSTSGGVAPAWSLTGDTIFYVAGGEMIAAEMDLGDIARVRSRSVVQVWPFPASGRLDREYDVHPDGFISVGTLATGAQLVVRTSVSGDQGGSR